MLTSEKKEQLQEGERTRAEGKGKKFLACSFNNKGASGTRTEVIAGKKGVDRAIRVIQLFYW